MVKFQRLIVPWKPLPLVTPWTSTIWPRFEDAGVDFAAHFEAADLVVFHAQLPQATTGFDLRLGEVAGDRLVDERGAAHADGHLHGAVAVGFRGS